jgi:hypothetical protein
VTHALAMEQSRGCGRPDDEATSGEAKPSSPYPRCVCGGGGSLSPSRCCATIGPRDGSFTRGCGYPRIPDG